MGLSLFKKKKKIKAKNKNKKISTNLGAVRSPAVP